MAPHPVRPRDSGGTAGSGRRRRCPGDGGLVIAAAVHAIPFFILGLGIWIIAKALGGSRRDRRGPRYDYRHSWTDQRPASGESGLP